MNPAADGVQEYTHVKTGTTHLFIGQGAVGRVKMTAGVEHGDTVQIINSGLQIPVTISGQTVQDGTGDPSPDNVRPIRGVTSYKGAMLPLNWPLFDGDSLQIGAASGCDKLVVVNGETSFSVQPISSGKQRIVLSGISDAHAPPNAATQASIYSSAYTPITGEQIYNGVSGICVTSSAQVSFFDPAIQTVQAAQEYFAANPMTVFYRSTGYAEANDIVVALETHTQGYLKMSDKESIYHNPVWTNSYSYQASNALNPASSVSNPSTTAGICSHFAASYTNNVVRTNEPIFGIMNANFYFSLDGAENAANAQAWFRQQRNSGTPVQVVYPLASAAVFAHPIAAQTVHAYEGAADFVAAEAGHSLTGKWLAFITDGNAMYFMGGTPCPYEVGDIYITAASANPQTRWPGTTWQQIQGRFLLAASSSYTAGSTGGSAAVTLTAQNIPQMTGQLGYCDGGFVPANGYARSVIKSGTGGGGTVLEGKTGSLSDRDPTGYYDSSLVRVGTSSPSSISILPPYLAVYIWRRTA